MPYMSRICFQWVITTWEFFVPFEFSSVISISIKCLFCQPCLQLYLMWRCYCSWIGCFFCRSDIICKYNACYMVPKTQTPQNETGRAQYPKCSPLPQFRSHASLELCGHCKYSFLGMWKSVFGPALNCLSFDSTKWQEGETLLRSAHVICSNLVSQLSTGLITTSIPSACPGFLKQSSWTFSFLQLCAGCSWDSSQQHMVFPTPHFSLCCTKRLHPALANISTHEDPERTV